MASVLFFFFFFFFATILFFNFICIEASIHDYTGEKFISKGNAFVLHGGSEGIYSPSPNQQESSSFIRFEEISFRRPKAGNLTTGVIHAIVFEVEDRETIGGSAYGGQRSICCTSDLAKLGFCTEGEVILRPSTHHRHYPEVLSSVFEGDNLVITLPSESMQITETGMYNLYFIHCDPNLEELVIEGKTVWKNPTGYLPGRMAPLMNFYMYMSFAFVVLGIFWFFQYARHWKEILQLQNCITLVIALGMFEMALWYFEYAKFNETGVRPVGITISAVTFATVKRTVERLIILMVSMGFGVVRPTLGGLKSKVILLGGTFLCASEVLELVENVGTINDLSGKARLFLVLPVATLDAFFILWIFTSLSTTLNKLQAKRMMAKLEIYRKFTNALVVAVILSVGGLIYELYFKSTDVYNERWQIAWIIPAYWQLLSFSVLCVICILWAPSQNATRYAYSSETNEEFDKEETMTLMNPSHVVEKDVFDDSLESGSSRSNEEVLNEDLEEEQGKTE